MQGILELDIVSGSGVGHGTPDFIALSERSNYIRDSQSTVAGPSSCASVALRRRLDITLLELSSHDHGYRMERPLCVNVWRKPSHMKKKGELDN